MSNKICTIYCKGQLILVTLGRIRTHMPQSASRNQNERDHLSPTKVKPNPQSPIVHPSLPTDQLTLSPQQWELVCFGDGCGTWWLPPSLQEMLHLSLEAVCFFKYIKLSLHVSFICSVI